jgi:FMN phosphatase YigB (HAD superfamily)
MAVAGVLFDLGGVVCGYHKDRRLSALAAACGLPAAVVGERLYDSGFVTECEAGRHGAAQMRQFLAGRLGFGGTPQEAARLWCTAFTPDKAVLAIVASLRASRRVGLLTNNDYLLLDALPSNFPEVALAFDAIAFSCVLGVAKPAAAAFTAATRLLGVPAADTLFIDDSQVHVTGARRAGLQAVQFTGAAQLAAELAAAGI